MDNKKISTHVGTIIIIIITITIGVFVWKFEKNKSAESELQVPPHIKKSDDRKTVRISSNWVLVSHVNFWNNPNLFANSDYKFPHIEFSYPENWEFKCCNDSDNASTHIIYSSKNHDESLPFIRITNHTLSGCPDLKNDCSIDKAIELTANEKFNRLILNVPSDKVLQKLELKKLNTQAFVYERAEKNSGFSRAYLINLKVDVVEIDFVNYESLNENFIENFLNRISFESK